MHPDYLSTRFAEELGVEQIRVQHHHAHVASCMGEHGLDEKVIGISLDGTGYGTDGNTWGSEFFIADLNGFEQRVHFDYLPLPGGDKVTKEPWRTGVSYLYKVFGDDFLKLDIPFIKSLDISRTGLILTSIQKKLNAPFSSSAGRLFDAVSAIVNCNSTASFHAEPPMRLEAIANVNVSGRYGFGIKDGIVVLDTMIAEIVKDIQDGKNLPDIAGKFHNTIIDVIFAVVNLLKKKTGINKVVLSGGTFQNRILIREVPRLLTNNGFEVFIHEKVPSNDGGIALGQLLIAAKKISKEL
jgi:hydrogenase maturation protein HypF